MHCFEFKTNNLEYYVCDKEQNSTENTGTLSKGDKSWISVLQQALMPVPSNSTSKNCY